MLKRYWSKIALGTLGLFFGCQAFPSGGQIFYDYSFINPAEMMLTEQVKASGELTFAIPRVNFNGTITPGAAFPAPLNSIAAARFARTGSTDSRTTYYLPGALYYQRLSPNLVVGFVFSTPYYVDLNFDADGVASYTTYITRTRSADLSPRVSYQFNDKFGIGAGFNAQYQSVQLIENFLGVGSLFPLTFTTNNFVNKVSAWGYGWDIGALYRPFLGTIISATYYSRISHNLKGNSSLVGAAFSNSLNAHLPRPQTVVLRGFQALSKQFGLIGALYWTKWDTLQQTLINGLALPAGASTAVLPFYYRNTYRFDYGIRLAPNEKWVILALGNYEQTPTVLAARNLSLPESNSYGVIGGIGYNFSKHWTMNGRYEHKFYQKAPLGSTPLGTNVNGIAQPYSDAGALELVYHA